MSRRATAKKRIISPDPMYRSRLVSMIISRLLQDGKKNVARRILYECMQSLEKLEGKVPTIASPVKPPNKQPTPIATQGSSVPAPLGNELATLPTGASQTNQEPPSLKIFQQAVFNVTPVVEVKSRRVGGSNYQVPLEVNAERGTALALRWIIQAARQRPGREMATKLANELLDASNKTGNAIRKREETHRMAEANKAFANYRF